MNDLGSIPQLVGSRVSLVKGSQHQMSLVLDPSDQGGGIEIIVESSATVRIGDSKTSFDAGPELAGRCLTMLGWRVAAFNVLPEGDLTIRFNDNAELQIHKEGPYESYQVAAEGNVVYVA